MTHAIRTGEQRAITADDLTGQQLVYLIRWGEFVKVGCSVDPYDRLQRVLTRGAVPEPRPAGDPVLLAAVPGGYDVESWLHVLLTPHREVGEWFRLEGAAVELVQFIQSGKTRAFATNIGPRGRHRG